MNQIFTDIISFFSLNLFFILRICVSAIIFVLFWVLRKPLTKLIVKILLKIFARRSDDLRESLRTALTKPLTLFFPVLGLYLGLLNLQLPVGFTAICTKGFRIALIICIACALINCVDVLLLLFSGIHKKLDGKTDKTVSAFIAKIAKGILIVFTVVIVISEVGYNITGLITGLGLGGLTFALAAQDWASNFFGGMVILLDKPFAVDDWITTPTIDGVVEDITLRSTRIRTFSNSLVVVPNSALANQPITNWSKMNKRRVNFTLQLTYSTSSEQLQQICQQITALLKSHQQVNQDTMTVAFDSYGESSLNILINFFTKPTAWDDYMQIKEEINYKIMEIVYANGAAFAFPSQSIYLENSEAKKEEV